LHRVSAAKASREGHKINRLRKDDPERDLPIKCLTQEA
jgi:hypothetical protein